MVSKADTRQCANIGLFQMVSEPDTGQCANKVGASKRGEHQAVC